jgi:cytochrome c551/c552
MKRLAYGAVCAGILLVLAGCGVRPVDESVLPTRVPRLDAAAFAVTVVPPTPDPTATPVPVPTTDPTSTPVPTATAAPTITPTVAPTVAPTVEPTATPTVAAEVTPSTEITAAAGVTASADVTAAAPGGFPPLGAPAAMPAPRELSPGVAAALLRADPMRGQQLTLSSGCIGCHSLDPNQVMPGPTWRNIGNVAATRVPGQNAELYLYNSIIHPNDYLVEGFLPNIMLQIYQDTLSEQNLADLIAYLLTLKNN